MSLQITCDVCGGVIHESASVNVFRMWNVMMAASIANIGLKHITTDKDYYICNHCFEQLVEFAEQVGKVEP